ncbi:MAG: hypothetical protein JNM25_07815 [Planctomycetes bacterium]|nr:hypothetical protein [Planctomycetota bacterium]
MKHLPVAACLCLAVASLPAQNFLLLPASANPSMELNSYDDLGLPFMSPNSRVQMFFDATEVGSQGFVADQLSLRYDGPIPQIGAPGPFSIQRLQLRIGVTTVSMPMATFAANLTQPLTTVYDGPWSFLPDTGSAAPHPWGGPSNTLQFPFSTPVTIAIPTGAWLVVELVVEGNNIFNIGFAHAILDGASTTGGVTNGTAVAFGQGCEAAVGQPPATMTTFGTYAPGAAHHANATGLGADAIAIYLVGLDNTQSGGVPLPVTLSGTSCTLYTDPALYSGIFADANGAVTGVQPAATLSIPADPVTSGIVVYEQFVSLVETANPWGFVLSNATQVTLGTFATPGRGTYTVSHDSNANALYGNDVRTFGYAVRLRTL